MLFERKAVRDRTAVERENVLSFWARELPRAPRTISNQSPVRADKTVVIVREGELSTLDLPRAVERQNRLAFELPRG